MADAGAVGSGIEGLVGGFLMGSDFSRQRRFDRQDNEDRRRRRQLEDERLRMFREDRGRSQAIEGLALRDERGLAFGKPTPTPVEQLRTGTGKALMTFEDLQAPEARSDELQARAVGRGTPEGFYRVAPDPVALEGERVRGLREGVGRFLAAGAPQDMLGEPNIIEGLASHDLLDDIMERYGATEDPRFSVSVGGITTKANTPEEAIAARDRFALPEEPEGPDRARVFDQTNSLADDFYREAQIPIEISAAVSKARAAGDTPVGDQTKIIALNKLLDPGSIVREGEFDRVGRAGGLATKAQFYFEQMKDGRLPESLREALDQEIAAQAQVAAEQFGPTMERYRQRAEAFGLEPSQVVFDPFASLDMSREADRAEVGQITEDMTDEEILAIIMGGPGGS